MLKSQQFCTFLLDSIFFGVEVERVQEVIRYQHTTRVPLAPPVVHGLINLRGQIVPVIALRRCLELNELSQKSFSKQLSFNVVVKNDDEVISLLVDDVGEVLEVSEDCFESPPKTLKGRARELIRGAYKLENQLLLILDIDKITDILDLKPQMNADERR
ncbi:MAG: chemotaxis protein CheW [Scytonema sp. PMC 1070.18]|nr:chemotaxis protein CheW [Scytonema sp. PMC 1070.18]